MKSLKKSYLKHKKVIRNVNQKSKNFLRKKNSI